MKHFSEAEWADFARKLVSPESRMQMQKHLDDGCHECQATVELWQSVLAIAEKESAFTPPAEVLRIVKAQFSALMTPQSSGVRLIFDSLLQPMTTGLRGSASARQFLYETDDYYIDLRLEPRSPEDRSCLVGQVLNRAGKQAAEGLDVRVHGGPQPIAQTLTNQFGEFQLEFGAAGGLYVSIRPHQGSEIVLPLYGVQGKSLDKKDLD